MSFGSSAGPARRSLPSRFAGQSEGANKDEARPVLDPVLTPGFTGFLGPPADAPGISRPKDALKRLKRPPLEAKLVAEPAEKGLAVAVELFSAPLAAEPLIRCTRLALERLLAGQTQSLKISGKTFPIAERVAFGGGRFNLAMTVAAAVSQVGGEFAVAGLCGLEG